MRIPLLSSSYRAINSRQWICGTCRQHRARLYSTPHPSNLRNGSLKIDQNSPASSNSQLLDNAQAIEKNSQSIPNQGLQKTHSNYNEPYFVTTPIFYVNGDPHVGHMHSMVVADVARRYKMPQNQRWSRTILSTGTDEHGMKVQKAALAKGEDPLEFCTAAARKFQTLAQQINMSNHVFIRTTQPDHMAAVHHLWNELQRRGYIYKGTHEGWYSVTDECFYKESQVEDCQDATGLPIKVSQETGSTVEWSSEENYCFSLSKLRTQLIHHYEKNPDAIVPRTYYRDVVKAITQSLEDISISRPKSRLTWGIEVPGDPEQTIYVWFDALVNYLTVTGYPWASEPEQKAPSIASSREDSAQVSMGEKATASREHGWPAAVHVIGKDIVRFHCIFWPAFLMAAGLEPPRQILVHGHWTLDGQKMSKSLGNVVSPSQVLDTFHPDIIRFYMIKEGGKEGDGNWSNDRIRDRSTYLANSWGNLISRMMSSKFNLRRAVENVFEKDSNGTYRGVSSHLPEEDAKLRETIDSTVRQIRHHMNELDFQAALLELEQIWRAGNQYATIIQPWTYDVDRLAFSSVQYLIGEVMRIGALFSQPFMPEKAASMLHILGVDHTRRDLRFAEWGADYLYGWKGDEPQPEPYVFPRPSEKNGTDNGESMAVLMQRKKAEKEAKKADQRTKAAA